MVLPGLTGRKPEFLGVKGMDIPTTFKNSALFPLAGNIQLGSFGKKDSWLALSIPANCLIFTNELFADFDISSSNRCYGIGCNGFSHQIVVNHGSRAFFPDFDAD